MDRLGKRWLVFGLASWLVMASLLSAEEPSWTRELAKKGSPVNLETLPKSWRETLQKVISSPTITTTAGSEKFYVNDELYRWLLDHPDRVANAWRRMGVPAVDIGSLGEGRFSWTDEQGSELIWQTVSASEERRIWYAEGKVKPGPLLPMVPVRAVAILRHEISKDSKGRISVRHSVEAYLQTDSKFATLVTRILGPAAPRMAEQSADQLLYYFSGIGRYLDSHPEKAATLLAEQKRK